MGNDCCECDSGKSMKGAECCSHKDCCEDSSMDHAKMMMDLANEAWSELMMDKMKIVYEKAMGDKMNKMAAVGVEACIAYWTNKMKEKGSCAEFEDKLKKAMM